MPGNIPNTPDYKVMRVKETGAFITSTPVKGRIMRMVLLSTLIWDFLAVDLWPPEILLTVIAST